MTHNGTTFTDLEKLVKRFERHTHLHVCYRCLETYPCLSQFVCSPPVNVQEESAFLCGSCLAISDDEEL